MTIHRRWFIVPAVTDADTTVPKYLDADPDLAFNGETTTPDVIERHYPALVQTNPDVQRWYLVQGAGEGNAAWQTLNRISTEPDTRNLATRMADVASVLNDRLPGLERSGEAWARSFRLILPRQDR